MASDVEAVELIAVAEIESAGRAAGSASAVSWAAIVGGALVAAATTLILIALGSGLGLAVVSPWANGPSPAEFTVGAAIWLILTQWIASGLGGYLTGRLRTRWIGTHSHEVFFRDTAHGFLTWALATVIAAALLGSASLVAAGAGVRAVGASMAPATDTPAPQALAYDVDSLFRSAHPDESPATADAKAEASRILIVGVANAGVPANDRAYLAQLVAAHAGASPLDAQQRVAAVVDREQAAVAQAKQAVDKARKAAAALALFTALSLMIGAFIACVAAALGGFERDQHP